jgi:hypothetical protein
MMPRVVVDLSARSQHIRDEPWHLHFWELTVPEALEYLRNPRHTLAEMGISLPDDCRIETVIENHDWLANHSDQLSAADGPIVVCNVGKGNVARAVYKVSMYAHHIDDVGKYEKTLLHPSNQEESGS